MIVQKIEWVRFHLVGSQCIKILLITNWKKKPFSSLKNSVHVEPVWFSLANLTLCAALTTAQWYCTRLKKIWDALKLFSHVRDDFFLLFSSNIETSCQQNKKKFTQTRDTVWHDPQKNNSPHPPPPPKKKKKINENIFPAKIYSRVLNLLIKK